MSVIIEFLLDKCRHFVLEYYKGEKTKQNLKKDMTSELSAGTHYSKSHINMKFQ